METTELDIGTVLAWHDAINHRDAVAVRNVTTSDVRMTGPRAEGGESGQEILIDWMNRSGIRLVVRSHHVSDGAVVVEEDARWEGDPQRHRIATVFRLSNGKISEISRYPSLDQALRQI